MFTCEATWGKAFPSMLENFEGEILSLIDMSRGVKFSFDLRR